MRTTHFGVLLSWRLWSDNLLWKLSLRKYSVIKQRLISDTLSWNPDLDSWEWDVKAWNSTRQHVTHVMGETKQQPIRAMSGHQISCCLVSLHFLCDILSSHSVLTHVRATSNLYVQEFPTINQTELNWDVAFQFLSQLETRRDAHSWQFGLDSGRPHNGESRIICQPLLEKCSTLSLSGGGTGNTLARTVSRREEWRTPK